MVKMFSDTFSTSKVDALLSLGLDTFGYDTLTIDDFWQLPERDPAGKWVCVLLNHSNCPEWW